MEKLKNNTFVNYLPKFLDLVQKILNLSSLILVCLILIFLFSALLQSDQEFEIDLKNNTSSNSCSVSEYKFINLAKEKYSDYELNIFRKDIYVYPEIQNISCIKKVDSFFINEDSKTIDVFINDSPKLFDLLDLLFNGFICLFLMLSRRNYFINFLNYIVFNLFLHIFFAVNLSLIKIIIPFSEPETSNQRYFFRILFLIILVINLKNLKIITLFTLTLLFFIPDYLGLFALIFLLTDSKKNFTYSNFDIYFFSSIPIIYYFSKYLFSLSSFFDKFWILSGQRIYHGYSRWYDLQWNFLTFRCNGEPNYKPEFYFKECRELYGGILDEYIIIRTDPYITAFAFQFLCLLILSYVYLNQIKRQEQKHLFFLMFIFVSPPMIFLINQGNPDLFIFLISFLVLNKQKPNYLLALSSLFLFFLFKLHPVGGIIGIFYYFLQNNKKKYLTLSSAFIVLCIATLTTQLGDFSGYGYMDLKLTIEEAYGIFHYSNIINSQNIFLTYAILIIFLLSLTRLKIVKTSASLIGDIEKNSYFYSLLFWFLLTSIYSNNSYRLPIFIVLFFIIYKIPDRKLQIILLSFIFLNPTPTIAYNFVQIIYHIVFGLSFFLITAVLSKFVMNEVQELAQKRYQQIKLRLVHKNKLR